MPVGEDKAAELAGDARGRLVVVALPKMEISEMGWPAERVPGKAGKPRDRTEESEGTGKACCREVMVTRGDAPKPGALLGSMWISMSRCRSGAEGPTLMV